MTQITNLQISNFRNLRCVSIQPSTSFNIFYGQNGAGKTSILEAIYYSGFGRSFRTNNLSRLICENNNQFLLYYQLKVKDNEISIGIERGKDASRRIRLNGDNIRSIAPIAKLLPIQLISTDSYRFFHDGPKLRRQFMNWGLFHVEPTFFPFWQQFLQLLKQRNAALKMKASSKEVSIWDSELVDLSEKINKQREKYVDQLKPLLEKLLSTILNSFSLKLSYQPGWNSIDSSFKKALSDCYRKDLALGYTSIGPHRADLQLLLDSATPAGEVLSQGQQKLASYALYLAQGQLVQTLANKTPIYLIDDLPSELDPQKRSFLSSLLTRLNAQVFITGITQQELRDVIALDNSQVFHVEQNDVISKATQPNVKQVQV